MQAPSLRVTLSTLTKLSSCFFREYLCVDKTGTLTTDHVTLLKHLNPQLRSSDTLLDLAYINSSMQASHTTLIRNDLRMAALLEACPGLEVLDMCPAGHCWSMTRLARSMQQPDRISVLLLLTALHARLLPSILGTQHPPACMLCMSSPCDLLLFAAL